MQRYRSEANERWVGFEHRPGDVVVSTRSKCGTTWVQMICLLLVHQQPDLPAPLAELSPWLDWEVDTIDDVRRRLDAQDHRRVIKTHTPLDGLPMDPQATYLVVGRHPLDVAESLYHHGRNIDRARLAELTGEAGRSPEGSFAEWAPRWIDPGVGPDESLDTLPGLVHHVQDAWARRGEQVVLVHYDELTADLDGQMRGLASRLGIVVAEDRWPALVAAADLRAMRARAAALAPDRHGVLADPDRFFRAASTDRARSTLPAHLRRRAVERTAALAAPEVAAWLLRDATTTT